MHLIDEKLEREIALTRTIVSLGRSARNKVNMKIRQPLSAIAVSMPKDDTELTEDDKAIILEELNIKRFSSAGPEALEEIFEYSVTPQFDRLGPKFGKKLNKAMEWIKSLDQQDIQKLIKFKFLKREIDGELLELSDDDVNIEKVEKPGWSITTEDEFGVAVCIEMTSELENEGLVRELIHKIQLMRKEADFDLVDRIKIFYEADAKLRDAINDNLDYLKNETLAVEVSALPAQGEVEQVLNINGIKTKIVLQRIKDV